MARIEAVRILLRALETFSDDSPVTYRAHLSKRLKSYTQDEDVVTIHFEDGSTATADLLIGADGIGSRTRHTMYGGLAERVRNTDPQRAEELEKRMSPVFTGTYQCRALVDAEKLRTTSPDNIALTGVFSVSSSHKTRECHCSFLYIVLRVWKGIIPSPQNSLHLILNSCCRLQ